MEEAVQCGEGFNLLHTHRDHTLHFISTLTGPVSVGKPLKTIDLGFLIYKMGTVIPALATLL